MKKRLLIISANKRGGWGGSEKFWYESLHAGDLQKTFDCHVALRRTAVNEIRQSRLSNVDVSTTLFDDEAQPSLVTRILERVKIRSRSDSLAWMRSAVNQIQPDLVWLNLGGFRRVVDIVAVADHCHQHHIPYVIVFQHGDELWIPAEAHLSHAPRVLNSAATILFVSDRNRRAMERALGSTLPNARLVKNSLLKETIATAANVPALTEQSSDPALRMVHFGRIEPSQKGHDILLECLSAPEWRERKWSLDFFGDGYARPLLKRWIDYFGLKHEAIRILDYTDDIWTTLLRYNLLVMPSRSEGAPFALMECMAAGRPAVATSVAGIPEIIDHGTNGWLADSTSTEAFNSALCMAWEERECLSRYGEAARLKIEQHFSQDIACPELTNVLRDAETPYVACSVPTKI